MSGAYRLGAGALLDEHVGVRLFERQRAELVEEHFEVVVGEACADHARGLEPLAVRVVGGQQQRAVVAGALAFAELRADGDQVQRVAQTLFQVVPLELEPPVRADAGLVDRVLFDGLDHQPLAADLHRLVQELLDRLEVLGLFGDHELDLVLEPVEGRPQRVASLLERGLEQRLAVEVEAVEEKETDLVLDVVDLDVLLGPAHQDLERQDLALGELALRFSGRSPRFRSLR